MSKQGLRLGLMVPVIFIIIAVGILAYYPVPTDQLGNIYHHLSLSTSGDGPAVGIAYVDPLTDVIFHQTAQEFGVVFLILAPNHRAIDLESIRYSAGNGIEVFEAVIEEVEVDDSWSAVYYMIRMVSNTAEIQHFSVHVSDELGLESSRLFYVIALG